MTHFDEMTALLYLENQLRPENADVVRAHASECTECRDLLEALNRESLWLRESLETDDESVPAHLVQAPEKGSAPWGWIAAMALGIGGAYTVWNGFIEPWRATAAEAGFTQGNLLTMLFFSGAFWKGWEAMRSMIEFTAVATVGILILWLVRKHLTRVAPAVVAMAGLTMALTLSPSAQARTSRARAAELHARFRPDHSHRFDRVRRFDADRWRRGRRFDCVVAKRDGERAREGRRDRVRAGAASERPGGRERAGVCFNGGTEFGCGAKRFVVGRQFQFEFGREGGRFGSIGHGRRHAGRADRGGPAGVRWRV